MKWLYVFLYLVLMELDFKINGNGFIPHVVNGLIGGIKLWAMIHFGNKVYIKLWGEN